MLLWQGSGSIRHQALQQGGDIDALGGGGKVPDGVADSVGYDALFVKIAYQGTGARNDDLQGDHCAEARAVEPEIHAVGEKPESGQDVVRNAERRGGGCIGLVPEDGQAGRSEDHGGIERRGGNTQGEVVRECGGD